MIIHSPKELALFVNSERKRLKLSQSRAGSLVGLKQATISAFENKPESTKLDTLFRILAASNLELRLSSRSETTSDDTEWEQEW